MAALSPLLSSALLFTYYSIFVACATVYELHSEYVSFRDRSDPDLILLPHIIVALIVSLYLISNSYITTLFVITINFAVNFTFYIF